MPWKIVNLDYDCERPHIHLCDPRAFIHLRTYFGEEKLVEVCLGAAAPDDCYLRALVTPGAVEVSATRFCEEDLRILDSVLASLDVEEESRAHALAWTNGMRPDDAGWYTGNAVTLSLQTATSWPRDLTDEALMDALRDTGQIPLVRRQTLAEEAKRRGFIAYGYA
jgi:hypothetical protein